MKKIISLLLAVILILSLSACGNKTGDTTGNDNGSSNNSDYQKAVELIENKKYEEAYDLLLTIKENEDAKELLSKFAFLTTEKFREYFDSREGEFADETTTYKYDTNGNALEMLIETKYANNESKSDKTIYVYDNNGNRISITYNDGSIAKYVYDSEGRLLSFTDNGGEIISYEYNKNGVAVVKTDKDGSIYEYNNNGLLLKKFVKHDKLAAVQTTLYYTYDDNGKLLEEKEVITNPTTGAEVSSTPLVTNTYDDNGNIITHNETDSYGSKKDTYYYDAAGNLIKEESNHKTKYTDKTIEEKIIVVTYTYENGNKVKEEKKITQKYNGETKETTSIINYVYDANGNMIEENFGKEKNTYSYDKYGNAIEKTVYEDYNTYLRDSVGYRLKLKIHYFPNGVPEDLNYIVKP